MNKEKETSKKYGLKRTILEWLGIAAVFGILYATGLHTEVIGTMQRALLWTGLFDADNAVVQSTEGPLLSEADYRFTMTDSTGQKIALNEFRGDLLFINIWASWCPPCVAEMPTIEDLYRDVSQHEHIRFLLISLDRNHAKGTRFMEQKEFPMPYYFPSSRLPSPFNTSTIPTTLVISKEGQIIYKKKGIADYSSQAFRRWLVEQADE